MSLSRSVSQLAKTTEMPGRIINSVGSKCSVLLGNMKKLHNLQYIGPKPILGQEVTVNFSFGDPVVFTNLTDDAIELAYNSPDLKVAREEIEPIDAELEEGVSDIVEEDSTASDLSPSYYMGSQTIWPLRGHARFTATNHYNSIPYVSWDNLEFDHGDLITWPVTIYDVVYYEKWSVNRTGHYLYLYRSEFSGWTPAGPALITCVYGRSAYSNIYFVGYVNASGVATISFSSRDGFYYLSGGVVHTWISCDTDSTTVYAQLDILYFGNSPSG